MTQRIQVPSAEARHAAHMDAQVAAGDDCALHVGAEEWDNTRSPDSTHFRTNSLASSRCPIPTMPPQGLHLPSPLARRRILDVERDDGHHIHIHTQR